MPPDPDAEARRTLARHRAFATFLLALMAALTLATYAMPEGYGTALLQASAKAGFVGGIADWFAVTALFRHPLGIPIPHTAIIPRQKARLGAALGRFVANNVFAPEELARLLERADLPGLLRGFLSDPVMARPAAEGLAALLPRVLDSVEDGRARRLIARLIPRLAGSPAAGRIVARALGTLVDGGRHQEVFGFMLGQLREGLTGREEALRAAIEGRVRKEGGALIGWALGATIARRVISAVNAELEKTAPDGSELRAAFDEWVRREIARMEADPARAAELGAAIGRVLRHESVQGWVWDVWARLRAALAADAAKPGGRAAQVIEGSFANFARLLEEDPAIRARVNQATGAVLASLLPELRKRLSGFIASVVSNWDAATITERLELRVGKDLQYVRVNGTLVGFLVGGALFALLRAVFGVVAF